MGQKITTDILMERKSGSYAQPPVESKSEMDQYMDEISNFEEGKKLRTLLNLKLDQALKDAGHVDTTTEEAAEEAEKILQSNEFQKSMNIYLIEKNIKLIEVQKSNILSLNYKPKKISWLKNFSKKNQYPNIIFANEFFDCFPVRQFFKKNQTWYEKMIEIKYNESSIKFKNVIINDKKTLKQLNQYSIYK